MSYLGRPPRRERKAENEMPADESASDAADAQAMLVQCNEVQPLKTNCAARKGSNKARAITTTVC